MNIVLIMSDTFRRDNLGCYGNKEISTPCLDKMGKRSIIFDRCYACSFPTMPARADIFTGRWTYTYMGWESLPTSENFLPEILQKAGYVSAAILDTPFLGKKMGYDRGFSHFEKILGQGPMPPSNIIAERRDRTTIYETNHCAPATMLAAERWLQHHRKDQFFLYIDTWDPHEPWDSPRWYVEKYHPGYDGRIVNPCYGFWEKRGISGEDLKISYASYKGEVSMVDRWIGFLLDGIEALNLTDNTMIIFTTDHGFYFGEHGIFGKMIKSDEGAGKPEKLVKPNESANTGWARSPLYEEVAHIPLLMYIPGIKSRRTNALVSLPDLMPTILEFAGVEVPDSVQARSLSPLLKEERKKHWDFVVTAHPLKHLGEETRVVDDRKRKIQANLPSTITSQDWSLIYSIENEPVELYHLPTDPKQEQNRIDDNIDIADNLLNNFVSRLEEAKTIPQLVNLRRRLKRE